MGWENTPVGQWHHVSSPKCAMDIAWPHEGLSGACYLQSLTFESAAGWPLAEVMSSRSSAAPFPVISCHLHVFKQEWQQSVLAPEYLRKQFCLRAEFLRADYSWQSTLLCAAKNTHPGIFGIQNRGTDEEAIVPLITLLRRLFFYWHGSAYTGEGCCACFACPSACPHEQNGGEGRGGSFQSGLPSCSPASSKRGEDQGLKCPCPTGGGWVGICGSLILIDQHKADYSKGAGLF